jgi:hypothetical protein
LAVDVLTDARATDGGINRKNKNALLFIFVGVTIQKKLILDTVVANLLFNGHNMLVIHSKK